MAKVIMVQGTASGVGKTVIATALCRIFTQDGYSVAPFKSQNMTANTAMIPGGGEIAVSQVLQAYAAKMEQDARINPIVLKPSPDGTGIILNGSPYGTGTVKNYSEIKAMLIAEIEKAYNSLAEQYDVIVIEGAGSPVELNLNKDGSDIVNMGIARRFNAPVLLVSDIDRGGMFASMYGTVMLLDEAERKYIKALIVNRFKGEMPFFADGAAILEEITGIPVAGVVPHISLDLPEEDALYGEPEPYIPGVNLDGQLDGLAEHVRRSLDMEMVYRILRGGVPV